MARTDRQIAEFMAYYSAAPKEEREWALKYIADIEGKSPAEVRSIYERYNANVNLRKGAPAPAELIETLKKEVKAGFSDTVLTKKYGVSGTLVQKARRLAKSEKGTEKETPVEPPKDKDEVEFEKYVDELEAKRAADKPSAPKTSDDFEIEDIKVYLPRNSDGTANKAQDISEIDLKKAIEYNQEKTLENFKAHLVEKEKREKEKIERLKLQIEQQRNNGNEINIERLAEPSDPSFCCGDDCPYDDNDGAAKDINVLTKDVKIKRGVPIIHGHPEMLSESGALWKALSEQLTDFALGTFGAGTKVTSVYWSDWNNEASIEVETVDGRKINITMEEYGNE